MALRDILKFRAKSLSTEGRAGLPVGHGINDALARLTRHGFRVGSIIDIGASDGKWSRMATRYFPEASILAVEPLAERGVELERLRSGHRAFVYEICAAGNADGGTALLNVTPELDGSYIGGGAGARKVPVRTVDSLVRQFAMSGPFLMKFDTHGYERQILEGACQTLANTPVIVMEMLNFGGLRFPELLCHLDGLGYRPLDVADIARTPTQQILWQFDFILVRKDHPLLVSASYT